jgi:hypothetical protein
VSKGFSAKAETKSHYIKNLLINSKEVRAGFSTVSEAREFHSRNWYKEYAAKRLNYSLEQLLNPERKELDVQLTSSKTDGNHSVNSLAIGFKGIWCIKLCKRRSGSINFDIAVITGNLYRFHSEVIKQDIVIRFGMDTYHQWKQIAADDISSLIDLVKAMRSTLKKTAWSYTCSDSAIRLCRRVGIRVEQGIAFLFPDGYA